MTPDKIEWDGMGNKWNYSCPACHHNQSIEPVGGAASLLAMILIVMAIPAAMMIDGFVRDWISWAIFFAIAVFFLWFPVSTVITHWRYPVTGEVELKIETDVLKDPIQKGIAKTESVGFWKGFFSPILLIITVLGIASVIGFVFNP